MEASFFALFITFIFFTTRFVVALNRYTKKRSHQLPPGPPTIPFFGNLLWMLIKSFSRSKPLIVIANHSVAYQALIDNSVIFAGRPQAMATDKFLSCEQHNISSAFYSPTWLQLRRNLTYNILHTSRIKSFACARKWALDALINRLKSHSSSYEYHYTEIREHIQHALYNKKIQEIKDLQRRLQLSFDEFKVLNLFPSLGKFVFHKRWEKLRQLRQDQEKLMVPLIKARKAMREGKNEKDEPFLPYVDTLFDLQLKEENRKLEERKL
ncbi:hypothetical protein J1N35_007252 [Gossypium stocksii]|uniref:Cytochrome P450 n=1 Tax=Gossypium stocksii TaxID=47602 RepID=A0A9D3W5P9_9ROSI|nr:hypothetical protein J1N35_007252 [Gossypium stocksii]